MPAAISNYALIGDGRTCALVSRAGSVDFLCWPRFDSDACFAALLGDESYGRWEIAPTGYVTGSARRYRGNTLVLETEVQTEEGSVRITDFMPWHDGPSGILRRVEGLGGRVAMRSALRRCFDYGRTPPWLELRGRTLRAEAGPDRVTLVAPAELVLEGEDARCSFTVEEGQTLDFALTYSDAALVGRLKGLRETIHKTVCERGFSAERGHFVQHYGNEVLDASLLLLPLVGFLPADDPRMAGTIAAIERELMDGGLVRRKAAKGDGSDEGAFLACSCWLADCMKMQGREGEAATLLERVIGLSNDVGLLSEEYHVPTRQLIGNIPQSLTHLGVVNTSLFLSGPVIQRGAG